MQFTLSPASPLMSWPSKTAQPHPAFRESVMPKRKSNKISGPDSPYEVGYGKPPKHTRFKPGRSGNPKGRPRGHRNLSTMIREVLNEKVALREGDRTRKVPKAVAVFIRVLNGALHGDQKDTIAYFQFIQRAGLLQDEQESPDTTASVDDKAIIAEFLRWQGVEPEENPSVDRVNGNLIDDAEPEAK
jgi:hypothetical protein